MTVDREGRKSRAAPEAEEGPCGGRLSSAPACCSFTLSSLAVAGITTQAPSTVAHPKWQLVGVASEHGRVCRGVLHGPRGLRPQDCWFSRSAPTPRSSEQSLGHHSHRSPEHGALERWTVPMPPHGRSLLPLRAHRPGLSLLGFLLSSPPTKDGLPEPRQATTAPEELVLSVYHAPHT